MKTRAIAVFYLIVALVVILIGVGLTMNFHDRSCFGFAIGSKTCDTIQRTIANGPHQ